MDKIYSIILAVLFRLVTSLTGVKDKIYIIV